MKKTNTPSHSYVESNIVELIELTDMWDQKIVHLVKLMRRIVATKGGGNWVGVDKQRIPNSYYIEIIISCSNILKHGSQAKGKTHIGGIGKGRKPKT
jgi:hypothetical protein